MTAHFGNIDPCRVWTTQRFTPGTRLVNGSDSGILSDEGKCPTNPNNRSQSPSLNWICPVRCTADNRFDAAVAVQYGSGLSGAIQSIGNAEGKDRLLQLIFPQTKIFEGTNARAWNVEKQRLSDDPIALVHVLPAENTKAALRRLVGVSNLAGPTGLEPATSGVTGRRSNQLNYDPAVVFTAAPFGVCALRLAARETLLTPSW